MPKWLLFTIIGLPVVGIVGVLTWDRFSPGPEAVVIDPNQGVVELEGRIAGFRAEYQAVFKLIQDERTEQADARGRKLADQLAQWLDEWEAIFEARRDEDGELPPELAAYESGPVPVLRLRNDLLRITGF